MLETTTVLKSDETAPAAGTADAIRAACARDLAPLVQKIDKEGFYPESVMRELGRLGAFSHHVPDCGDDINLGAAVDAMAAAGEYCLSTSFCMWCQDAFAWYIFASQNQSLKHGIGRRAAQGDVLGGTLPRVLPPLLPRPQSPDRRSPPGECGVRAGI